MTSKNQKGWVLWSKLAKNREEAKFYEKLWEASGAYPEDFEPDVERGLSRFKNTIHNNREKVVRMSTTTRWIRVAAAVLILLGAGILIRNFLDADNALQTINTTNGMTKKVTLTDGTVLWLNENSELTFPKKFDGKQRKVKLNGEGFFNVAENPERPFIIESENIFVEVLGTAFNFRDYEGQEVSEVHVEHGRVALSDKEGHHSEILESGDCGEFVNETQKISTRHDPRFNSFAWRTKKLSFRGDDLKEIFKTIEKFCRIDLDIEHEEILHCPYTTDVALGDVENVLKSIEKASGQKLKFKKLDDKTYRVSGQACNNRE